MHLNIINFRMVVNLLKNPLFTSLRWRFTITIAISTIPLLLLAILFPSFQITQILSQNAQQELKLSAMSLADNADRWNKQNTLALQNLSTLPDIVGMNPKKQKPILVNMAKTYGNLYLVSTTNRQGLNVARNDQKRLIDYSDRLWFQKAIAGRPVTYQSVLSRTTNKPGLVISIPIRSGQEIVGVAMQGTDLAVVAEKVGAVKVGKTGYAFVVDDSGQVLAHPNPQMLVKGSKLNKLDQYPPVRSLLAQHIGAFSFIDAQGVTWQAYTMVIANGWGIIVQQQEVEVMAESRIFWAIAILIAVIAVIILSLLTWAIASRLVAPIRNLSDIVTTISAGDLGKRINIDSQDELGVLAKSFNHMTEQLQSSFIRLEQVNCGLERRVEERTEELKIAAAAIQGLNEKLKQENLRMSTELDIVRRLQQMILPKEHELIEVSDLDIAGFMEPANEVGGDYYDILQNSHKVRIGIGDVTGHGLESGVLMIMVQAAMKALLAVEECAPIKTLNAINLAIYQNVQRMGSNKNLSFAVMDYSNGYVNLSGQHEEALVIRHNGELERINTDDLGFPIGLVEDISDFASLEQIYLNPGDGMVIYTDGVTEAEGADHHLYGIDKLMAIVQKSWHKSAREIQEAVIADVRSHVDGHKIYDDITLVVLKRK